ncbi:MAG: glycosyltransferase N-terminal domain-containing protein [Pseudomonadota bacterium]
MARGAALSLYMIAAARPRSETVGSDERPERPHGIVFWCHLSDPDDIGAATELAYQLQIGSFPNLTLLATAATPITAVPGIIEPFMEIVPDENTAAIDRFLAHWKPDLAAFIGTDVRPALLLRADERGVPLLLLNAHAPPRVLPGVTAPVLARFAQIMALGPKDALELRRLAGRKTAIQVTERLIEGASPLPCDEVLLNEMAKAVGGRPVWLAINIDAHEAQAFEHAYRKASALAHRLLAIVSPGDDLAVDDLVLRLSESGLRVARRSTDGVPDANCQIFVADTGPDDGIWYRLAAVSYLGKSLSLPGGGTNPMASAALGSAILHGPHVDGHRRRYDRLARAGATRMVINGESLGVAVGSLMNPDRAAAMAHAAWSATSDSASVVDRLVEMITEILEEAS